MNATPQPPGWYDDPEDASQLRYWNGSQWTADRSPKAGAPAAAAPVQPQVVAGPEEYPVRLDIDYQQEYNRWLPLVKWLLLFPHLICLIGLGFAALFAWLYAAFAILFTRRYPRGVFDFLVGVARWGSRVNGYYLLMTDEYPPFSLQDDPAYPVRYDVEYPEQGVDRWRPFFAGLLAYPYNIVAGALTFAASFVVFVVLFAILFTKRYPEGMFEFVLNSYRWQARGNAYSLAMTTRYPPWSWG